MESGLWVVSCWEWVMESRLCRREGGEWVVELAVISLLRNFVLFLQIFSEGESWQPNLCVWKRFLLCWLSILSFTISFRFSQFLVKERIGGQQYVNFFILIKMFVKLLILSLVFYGSFGETGFQRAGALIKEPLNSHKQINDIILIGIIDQLKEVAYKLQVLRMRLGHAWELVFTDYGFIKQPSGIDLINHRCKIAVELKNGYKINQSIDVKIFTD